MSRGKRTGYDVRSTKDGPGRPTTPARMAEPPTNAPARHRSPAGRHPFGCWHRTAFERQLRRHRQAQDKLERKLQVGPGSKRGW